LSTLPDEFKVSLESRDGACVVFVSGEIDLATHDELTAKLREAARGEQPVVVDLSACHFIDSSGIRALLLGEREASGFSIAGAAEQVKRVLEMTGVTQAVPVHGTLEQALESL
jgi:anti-sigma B factor antagonist